MKTYYQRFIAMILAVVFTLSMCVTSAPSASANEQDDSNLVTWFLDSVRDNLDQAYQFVRQVSANYVFSSGVNHVTPAALQQACSNYRGNFFTNLAAILDDETRALAIWDGLVDGYDFCYVCLDEDTGRVRLRNKKFGYWITNDLGEYPWCTLEEWNAATENVALTPAFDPSVGQWVKHSELQSFDKKIRVHMVSVDELKYLASEVQKKGWKHVALSNVIIDGVGYLCIRRQYENTEGDEFDMVWCNINGCPYVVPIELDKMASQNSTNNNFNAGKDMTEGSSTYNQTTNFDNSNNYNGPMIDLSNSTFNLTTETGDHYTQYIDQVTFDHSDHSYHVTTYDVTFNQTNNYYTYNYYTYNIQYTYNNTYITYIGSTAEYQPKEWELYYELPDGRSSADLTEEDVAGLSFQFADCINYKKSATDTALRALYHFDGNTNDSGFFSDKTSFVWNSGASITYMESNAFNGALYLDEKAHKFTITLPSKIGTGDFTLQWRYYQNSATTTDHNENYVTVGGTKLMGWSEQAIYNGSGTEVGALAVGTWQELAIVRNKGTVYLYHNGVKIGSVSSSSVLTDKIVFYLGANSRAHSMLDEMRFVKGAVYTGGKAYTPTSVPYDSNAVLVLPDSPVPVVDNYWNFDKTHTPTYSFDFTTFSSYKFPTSTSSSKEQWGFGADDVGTSFFCSENPDFSFDGDGLSLACSGSYYYPYTSPVILDFYRSVGSNYKSFPFFSSYVFNDDLEIKRTYMDAGSLLSGIYTVTVLFADGTSASATKTITHSATTTSSTIFNLNNATNTLTVFERYYYSYQSSSSLRAKAQFWGLVGTANVVYMEIVPGSVANKHEYVTATYDADELQPNTAAIQTDIPINGYTVGGVRPTFPQRGNVWFRVEGSRISGVQIYNGQAWEEVNARWWTGSRWIPIYAFDLVTLSDMWDITSADGSGDVTPPITSDTGFWNWWKKAWNDFTGKLFDILGDGFGSGPGSGDGSGSGSGSGDGSGGKGFFEKILDALADGVSKLIEALFDVITEIFKVLLSVVTDMLSAIFSFVTDTVLGGIRSFFSFFTDGSLFEFFRGTETVIDPDGNEVEVVVATLPEGIAAVFSVFAGIIMLLPWELRSLLIFGVAAAVLIAVFKLTRA